MNVVIALTYYSPHWTGLTEHARRLAEGLIKKGHSVTVVCTQHNSTLPHRDILHGVQVVRTKVIGRISRTLLSPTFISTVLSVSNNADVIIVYTPLAEVLPLMVGLFIRQKKMVLIHNGDLLLPNGFVNRLIERFFDISMRISGALSHGIISYSDDYTKYSRVLRHFESKTTAILPLFPKHSKKNSKQLTIPNKKSPVIGFAGRFVEEKGFDILLKAIPIVVKRYPDAIFIFAGEKNIEYETFYQANRELLNQLDRYVFSVGLLRQEEMNAFYNALDIFVLPSRSDCLAFVQVEAMLRGVPVVATNIPGARIAVQKTGMGLLVNPEDVRDLAIGIMTLCENKNMYKKHRDKAEVLFDYHTTLVAYERYLKKIVDNI